MSKIGRKPINIGNVTVEINGKELSYKGKKAAGVHALPAILEFTISEKELSIVPVEHNQDTNRLWGLHRALVANKIQGADVGFEKKMRIVGLGYKAILSGSNMEFSLGYSHKINYTLPEEVTVEVDRSGQLLTFKSFDKERLGSVCSHVRSLRKPEPYKGTGIRYEDEHIVRKAGKTKS